METGRVSSEELTEWEQIQSPYATTKQPQSNSNNSNTKVIKEDFYSVFPPGNHQDLPINTTHDSNLQSQDQRPINLLPSSADDGARRRWNRLHWEVLRSVISRISRGVKKYATHKVGLWSFSWALAGVSALSLVLFLRIKVRLRWRRSVQLENSRESLMLLIKERDKKINQLLLQIAQMNEILLARRKVQVIRVK